MNRFAALIDRLGYEPRRNAKLRLMTDYFRETPDPERGWALAALTGALSFRHAKPGLIKGLIEERTDPVLFALSYDYVGDLAETVALMWPAEGGANEIPHLSDIVAGLNETTKADLPRRLAGWLDALDETGRWALLKLITGAMRIGASARLAKTAVARLGTLEPNEIELVWHGLTPPYLDLFAWAEGAGPKPDTVNPAPFHPPMLSHPLEDVGNWHEALDAADFAAEWKWDGIRVQAVGGRDSHGRRVARLYSRTGEDVSAAFPDVVDAIRFEGALDGELLILREGRVQSFNVLQQRLNRKAISAKLLTDFPAHIRAYDLLVDHGEDIRGLTFIERRARLEALVAKLDHERIDLSPIVHFANWDALTSARASPASAGASKDAEAVEGIMLKRRDSTYVPGRPKGPWFKWKRDAYTVDAVMMYAQRGHGKRSSFYSDYTFGLWRQGENGIDELVPVGKAYSGITDEELAALDRFVRKNTTNRFGPVREVVHTRDAGVVLEIAFEGLNRSTRHRSGVAMRFPRIHRIRWDKPAREADRLEHLEALLREA
ncbi:cisplatin damage response ATP-dependent DNA ligase [Hyphomicrobium sp. CS1BSMeth3]|uniref:cisplatin damage response ATP-dependent DNA ligase n=1 Tax=Hyphomicrobium sp. CS1BSMeth3 TaxID=1892844 RepID=UPI000930B08E|nr:cisplatin damage response ATP-dependent DNA ligase [Hyphomicrobium sp. CS1BSMeth3]